MNELKFPTFSIIFKQRIGICFFSTEQPFSGSQWDISMLNKITTIFDISMSTLNNTNYYQRKFSVYIFSKPAKIMRKENLRSFYYYILILSSNYIRRRNFKMYTISLNKIIWGGSCPNIGKINRHGDDRLRPIASPPCTPMAFLVGDNQENLRIRHLSPLTQEP